MRNPLFRLLGLHTALIFGIVAALFVGVLTALYMTSGYAIEIYTSDQIKRIPWDVSLGQKDLVSNFAQVNRAVARTDGVERAETFGMLRVQNGKGVELLVDGRPISARWLGIVGTSDRQLLPPPLRSPPADCSVSGTICAHVGTVGGRGANSMVLPIFEGSRLQLVVKGGSLHGEETVNRETGDAHSHDGGGHGAEWAVLAPGSPNLLVDLKVSGTVARVDRAEFNKDMLRRQGSLTYLPDLAVLAVVPMKEFERLAVLLDGTFLSAGGMHGGASAPPYVPQVDHLVKLERERFIVPFHIARSLDRVVPQSKNLLGVARSLTPFVDERSDLATVLTRMNEIGNSVGFVTLLVAIPLLWLGWTVANMLIELLLMNDRRKIGLVLVRGIPMRSVVRTVSSALLIGGVLGSLVGLAAGVILPVLSYKLGGIDPPPADYLSGGLAFFGAYFVLGGLLAAIVGWRLMNRIKALTPKQASARQIDLGGEPGGRVTLSLIAFLMCIAAGGYKIASLVLSSRPISSVTPSEPLSATSYGIDSVLTLLAIPLLLLGIIGVLRLRPRWMGAIFSALTRPIAGPRLSAFVAHHMVISRHRIAGIMFVAALATALVIVPQVARDSFNNRVGRGVEMAVGGDVQFEFDLGEVARSENPQTVGEFERRLARPIAAIRRSIDRSFAGARVNVLQQYVIPGYFVPDQSGLMLTLIDDPAAYLDHAPHTASLGLSRPFPAIIENLAPDSLAVSRGLLAVRQINRDQRVTLDYAKDESPLQSRFGDVVAFLPGQPTRDVNQHKGFALAEIDYVNTIMASDARAISSLKAFNASGLKKLEVLPSRLVFLVRSSVPANPRMIEEASRSLPERPEATRWVAAEIASAGKDMFVALSMENMKVFLVGGLILALTGIVAVNIVNFQSERRTFGLVRLRGASPTDMVRILLAFFLTPVIAGLMLGSVLGLLSGFATAQAIWNMPRIFGVAGILPGHLAVSGYAILVTLVFCLALLGVALMLAFAPLRYSTKTNIREG